MMKVKMLIDDEKLFQKQKVNVMRNTKTFFFGRWVDGEKLKNE